MTDNILTKIYKGNREAELYLYVTLAKGIEPVPETLLERMGNLQEVMTINLTADRKLARADTHKVMTELSENGFYLQMPPQEQYPPFPVDPE